MTNRTNIRRIILIFLLAVLFFFMSCGIPTYHYYGYDISVGSYSRDINGNSYDVGFYVQINWSGDYLNSLEDGTPGVLLTYSVAPSASGLSSTFNSYIRNTSGYYNGTAAIFSGSNYYLNNVRATYEGGTIHLFPFTGENNLSLNTAPSYTYDISDIRDFRNYDTYYFMLKKSTSSSDGSFYFLMDVYAYNSTTGVYEQINSNIPLYRYNNESFYSVVSGHTNDPDYSYYSTSEYGEYICFAFAVDLVPSTANDSSNTYWTELAYTDIEY